MLRLAADDLDVGAQALEVAADTRDQTAATDGYDDAVDVGQLLADFQPDGALASDDKRIIVGVDEDGTPLFGVAAGVDFGIEAVLTLEFIVHIEGADEG